jgi:hypothetical protein
MTHVVRCFPLSDHEFEVDVASEILAAEGQAGAALSGLRDKYPSIRIVERMAVARTDGEDETAWYCFRDGRAIAGFDGAPAMGVRTRVQTVTDESLDLIDWASELLHRSRAAVAEASHAVERSRSSPPHRRRGTRSLVAVSGASRGCGAARGPILPSRGDTDPPSDGTTGAR